MATVTPNKRPSCQFTLLEDMTETLTKEPVTADQIIYAAMFGGAFSGIKPYDSTTTYSKTDHILYTNTDGSICILTPKRDGVTGTFDMTKWSVYNLLAGSGGGSGSGNAMSDTKLVTNLNNIIVGSIMKI